MIKECTAYEERFAAWLDGKLTLREKIALQDHVEECPSCQKEILAMKHHWDRVALLIHVPPLKRQQEKSSLRNRFLQFWGRIRQTIWHPSSRSGHGNGGCP